MSKLLIRDEWYENVSSAAYWEAEFEQLIAQDAELLFPEYYLVPFKTDVESEYGTARPDFALIDRRYRGWWIVEVELAHHSLSAHVAPQVQKLAAGSYDSGHADYLAGQLSRLDPAAMRAMMKGAQPRVAVVVNMPRQSWVAELRRFDAIVAVLEVYRSEMNHHVLRLNGEYPTPPPDALSKCRWDSAIRRFLLVESPATLGAQSPWYDIEYEGSTTSWQRVETRDKVWLNPLKANTLPSRDSFILSRVGDRLVLEPLRREEST